MFRTHHVEQLAGGSAAGEGPPSQTGEVFDLTGTDDDDEVLTSDDDDDDGDLIFVDLNSNAMGADAPMKRSQGGASGEGPPSKKSRPGELTTNVYGIDNIDTEEDDDGDLIPVEFKPTAGGAADPIGQAPGGSADNPILFDKMLKDTIIDIKKLSDVPAIEVGEFTNPQLNKTEIESLKPTEFKRIIELWGGGWHVCAEHTGLFKTLAESAEMQWLIPITNRVFKIIQNNLTNTEYGAVPDKNLFNREFIEVVSHRYPKDACDFEEGCSHLHNLFLQFDAGMWEAWRALVLAVPDKNSSPTFRFLVAAARLLTALAECESLDDMVNKEVFKNTLLLRTKIK
jgi:hypothetical protein